MRTYNIIWTEYKNGIIEAKDRKEAREKGTKMIYNGKLKGGLNDFNIYEITTKFMYLHCPKCGYMHWSNKRKCPTKKYMNLLGLKK